MFEEYESVLEVPEACEALKMGKNYLYKLLQSGDIKAYKVGRHWKIPRQSLIEFINDYCKH